MGQISLATPSKVSYYWSCQCSDSFNQPYHCWVFFNPMAFILTKTQPLVRVVLSSYGRSGEYTVPYRVILSERNLFPARRISMSAFLLDTECQSLFFSLQRNNHYWSCGGCNVLGKLYGITTEFIFSWKEGHWLKRSIIAMYYVFIIDHVTNAISSCCARLQCERLH